MTDTELTADTLAGLAEYCSEFLVHAVDEEGKQKSEVELLIERIQKIQSELPAHTENENERAFTEAAEEYYREQHLPMRRNARKHLF